MSLIDLARLRQCLGTSACRFDVDALDACDSTNSEAMRRAAAGQASGTVVVADVQHAGRGRRGRHWLSAPADSLTFSVIWRFDPRTTPLSGLSLSVGVAIVRALASLGIADVGLKWPNDVLRRDAGGWRKLAGVLVELSTDRRGVAAVIGIGLNLNAPEGDLDQPATGLGDAGQPAPDRHVLLAALLSELAAVLDAFSSAGFACIADEWSARHAFAGESVRILEDGRQQLAGVCRGVDGEGALLVEVGGRIERCLSGDVSVRLS